MSERQVLIGYAQQLPEVLHQLYQTPASPAEWTGFLSGLVQASASRSARLLVMDRHASRVHFSSKVNIDDDQHQQYVDHFVNLCPWRPELAQKDPGRLYNTYYEFSCKQPEFYKTEFFNDWARHLDIEHGLCGTVYQDDRYTVQLLVQRTGGQGAFPVALTRQINQLIPHVRQVLELNRMVALQQQHSLTALAAAERAFMPFLLFDSLGRVAYASQRARALVDLSADIALENGQLRLRCDRSQFQFRQWMQQALLLGDQASSEVMVLSGEGRETALRLVLEPVIMAPAYGGLWEQDTAVVVYLQDPAEHLDIDRQALTRTLGLTQAEARIAAGLAQGRDPASLADEAGVSVHTVRTQIKSILAKTGVGRQAELVALVLRSVAVRSVGSRLAPAGDLAEI